MRIRAMTATFGKLEHAVLTLEPGLNVIHAPNEWGKSTWCAFLGAMLYGIDTRAKSTKTALADKERYAPWSGVPMEGRIDLQWQGRSITIERRTRGRVPLGEFRAWETDTGLPLPELTAANCGQLLLGVEQSVFRRAGFVRLEDMPVTADEDLRRRLNALVTTGDENADGEDLARKLRELRNRCRYKRSGLIPQAQEERQAQEDRLRELETLEEQCRKLKQRLGEVKGRQQLLTNHRKALDYGAAQADAEQVARARDVHDRALEQLERLESRCAGQPSPQEAREKLRQLHSFARQWEAARQLQEAAPEPPLPPRTPEVFAGLSADASARRVEEDLEAFRKYRSRPLGLLWALMAGAAAALGTAGVLPRQWVGPAAAVTAAAALIWAVREVRGRRRRKALAARYGSHVPQDWMALLEDHLSRRREYEKQLLEYNASRQEQEERLSALEKQRLSLCAGQTPEKVMNAWQQVLGLWEEFEAAHRQLQQAQQHLQTLRSMARTAPAPEMEDSLTWSREETEALLTEAAAEQQRLQNRLGQYQGRMETLGDRQSLQVRLAAADARLEKLEQTYRALTVALDTLTAARQELQRRFAPRITRRARELLGLLTGGRYDRLVLGEDFGLLAGAQGEDTLRSALWRSDGTVDQLYLALRLAVAEELTPEAPLVLDDALARFDEQRLDAALEVLRQQAQTKQVIVFTCRNPDR